MMTFTYVLAWWHIPTLITLVMYGWAMFWPTSGDWLAGIDVLFRMIPASIITIISWIVAGIVK